MMARLQLKKKSDQGVSLFICGTIQKVLAGEPDKQCESSTFDAERYKMGLGAASPESFDSMGEGIMINGVCYATVTNASESELMKTVGGKTYYSTLMSGVPNEAAPNYVSEEAKIEAGMYEFLSGLYQQTKRSIIWRGVVKCQQINSMILKKSPIYGVPIFDDKENYLLNKVFDEPYWVYMVGAFIGDEEPNQDLADHLKERIFYVNPLDEKVDILTHTHGLLLNKEVSSPQESCERIASHAVHILNKNTIISDVKFLELYTIDHVQPLEPTSKRI